MNTLEVFRRNRPDGFVMGMVLIFFGVVGCIVASSCVSTGDPVLRDENIVSQIRAGVSTKDDVQLLLGEPNEITRDPGPISGDGEMTTKTPVVETWTYTYLDRRPSFPPGGKTKTGAIIISFDEKGVAQQVTRSQTTNP